MGKNSGARKNTTEEAKASLKLCSYNEELFGSFGSNCSQLLGLLHCIQHQHLRTSSVSLLESPQKQWVLLNWCWQSPVIIRGQIKELPQAGSSMWVLYLTPLCLIFIQFSYFFLMFPYFLMHQKIHQKAIPPGYPLCSEVVLQLLYIQYIRMQSNAMFHRSKPYWSQWNSLLNRHAYNALLSRQAWICSQTTSLD